MMKKQQKKSRFDSRSETVASAADEERRSSASSSTLYKTVDEARGSGSFHTVNIYLPSGPGVSGPPLPSHVSLWDGGAGAGMCADRGAY